MSIQLSSPWRRRLIGGLLTWLIPFLVAIPFYGKDGLLIDFQLFKSLMIVVGSITAAILIIWSFRSIRKDYIREAIVTGLVWLLANWVLDLIILVGLLGMTLPDYATQIGLRYLVIPAMVIAAGIVADEAAKKR
jgi:signal transduction histidine kinase